MEDDSSGRCLSRHRDCIFRALRGHGAAVRAHLGDGSMDGIYLVGTAVSAFLFVYLIVALLKPEWFA